MTSTSLSPSTICSLKTSYRYPASSQVTIFCTYSIVSHRFHDHRLSWQGAKFRREHHSLSFLTPALFLLLTVCLQFEKMRWFHPNILLFLMNVSFALDCELLLHTGNNGTEAPCLFKRYHTVRARELRIVFFPNWFACVLWESSASTQGSSCHGLLCLHSPLEFT